MSSRSRRSPSMASPAGDRCVLETWVVAPPWRLSGCAEGLPGDESEGRVCVCGLRGRQEPGSGARPLPRSSCRRRERLAQKQQQLLRRGQQIPIRTQLRAAASLHSSPAPKRRRNVLGKPETVSGHGAEVARTASIGGEGKPSAPEAAAAPSPSAEREAYPPSEKGATREDIPARWPEMI
ncbi:uncharacterized protein LOC144326904 [Podarcis muralis]